MKLEMLESAENAMRFVVDGAPPSAVNALRRTLLSDVPKLAIETVEFHLGNIVDDRGKEYESVTPLFDEIIAHRLGLIPIPTDLGIYVPRKNCKCGGEGCTMCTIMYKIDKRGPCTVYSGDLIPLGDPKLAPRDDLIPIVKLSDKQGILAYAIAELGSGKDHAKWSPCHGVGYKYHPEIEVNAKKVTDARAIVDSCPTKVFDESGKNSVSAARPVDCIFCGQCKDAGGKDAVIVRGSERKFVFNFETDGSISAHDALLHGLRRLQEMSEEFAAAVGD
jgi:DNA-directed RNA polymerase subunit D